MNRIFTLALSFFITNLVAQNVGIGTMTPHASAKLHVESTNSGFLVPRVSLVNVTNGVSPINTPATGLMVWNTNAAIAGGNGIGFYAWDGSQWVKLVSSNTALPTQDHDFYEVGTTTAPNAITDNIFTMGSMGVGTNTPGHRLDISNGNTSLDNYLYIKDFDDATESMNLISRDGALMGWTGGWIAGQYADGAIPAGFGTTGTLLSRGQSAFAVSTGNVGIGNTTPEVKLDLRNFPLQWANRSSLGTDQGGSIELGGSATVAGTGTPFIDFHYNGLIQDYNTRIINHINGGLFFAASAYSEFSNGVRMAGIPASVTNTVVLTRNATNDIETRVIPADIWDGDANTTYTAGTGLSLVGTTFNNTAPDQTVSLTGAGATTISGTYPNFTITSTDNNTTYTAGTGLTLTGTTFSNNFGTSIESAEITDGTIAAADLNQMGATSGQVLGWNGTNWTPTTPANDGDWLFNGTHIYNGNTGNVGIGIAAPAQKLHVVGNGQFDLGGGNISLTKNGGHHTLWINSTTAGENAQMYFRTDGPHYWTVGADDSDGDKFKISDAVGFGSSRFTMDSNGDIGIGNTTPEVKLDLRSFPLQWANRSGLTTDQGGSIELGASNTTSGTGTPFIDFHYNGLTQDYNARIINNINGGLLFLASTRSEFSNGIRMGGIPASVTNTVVLTRNATNDIETRVIPADIWDGDANTTYTAGTGLSLVGTTFNNTAPDQTVSLTGAGATTISGTYPNFTITSTDNVNDADANPTNELQTISKVGSTVTLSNGGGSFTDDNTTYTAGTGLSLVGTTFNNTAPDQTVSLTGAGATTISGTYPNFTITSTDNNTTYTAGTGLTLTGTTFSNNFGTSIESAEITDGTIAAADLNQMGATSGQVLGWNGTNWTPTTPAQDHDWYEVGGTTAPDNINDNKFTFGKIGMGINNPVADLHIVGNDGVVATGTFASGIIPATGAGTRMMWYPNKAAFRVGQVTGTQWDDANIGTHSFSSGYNNTAASNYSSVFGTNNTIFPNNPSCFVSGNSNTVIGNISSSGALFGSQNNAAGIGFLASGQQNFINGSRSFVGGFLDTVMSDQSAVLTGYYNAIRVNASGAILSGFYNKIGNGTTQAHYSSIVGGYGNQIYDYYNFIGGGNSNVINNTASATTGQSSIVGGQSNVISADYAFIGGGQGNRNNANYSIIGGGDNNNISTTTATYATIAGGSSNTISSDFSFIGGGISNNALGRISVIGGGSGNSIAAAVGWSVVGGGQSNSVSGNYSNISGGQTNTVVNSTHSTVAGGQLNNVLSTSHGAVLGGYNNDLLAGTYNTIGGGRDNNTSDDYTFIGGGLQNQITGASAEYSSIVGGRQNTLTGLYGVVGGGYLNQLGGLYSGIFSGSTNIVTSSLSGILSGSINIISGTLSAIGGGQFNTVIAGRAFLGSGEKDTITSLGSYGFLGAGFDNQLDMRYSVIVGGIYNSISGSNVVNSVDSAAFIGAGRGNISYFSNASVITGGISNEVNYSDYGLIVGGGDNLVYNSVYSSIIGGWTNKVEVSTFSIIGGGYNNRILTNSDYATITSGRNNTLGLVNPAGHSVISGGFNNQVNGSFSFIGSGVNNTNTASSSVIVGGQTNTIIGANAFIGGGSNNTISGSSTNSVVVGGIRNTASADYSSVLGGSDNVASGMYSVALGRYANTNARMGSFVFSDASSLANTNATANNQFMVRASGGAIFYSDAAMTAGVQLASGAGAWATISDKNKKENFEKLDGEMVLNKIAQMPITTWNYISQDDKIRHIGPMAQDFYAAFKLGESDTTITTTDIDGINLLAVQALEERSRQIQAENQALATELANLKALLQDKEKETTRLQSLETRLKNIEATLGISLKE